MSGEQPQDYPPAEEWMRKAADDIDIKLGLPRHDQAPEWCAMSMPRFDRSKSPRLPLK